MSKINPTRSTLLVGLLLFGLLASALPYSSAVRGQGNATPAATVSAAKTSIGHFPASNVRAVNM